MDRVLARRGTRRLGQANVSPDVRVDRWKGVEDHFLLRHFHGGANVLHDAAGVQRTLLDDPRQQIGQNAFQIRVK